MSSNIGNQPNDPSAIIQQQLEQEQLKSLTTPDATTAGQVPIASPHGQLLADMNTAVAGMSSQDTVQSANSGVDTSQFSSISQAYTAGFLSGVQSDSPDLAAFKTNFDPDQVAAQLTNNGISDWLDGSYMVTMADTSMQRGNMTKDQEFKQNMIAASFFSLIFDIGQTLGALAEKKANLEAQQYAFEAGMLFVGLGITVGAGAMSLAGTGLAHGAGAMKGEEDPEGTSMTTAGAGKDDIPEGEEASSISGSGGTGSKFKSATATSTESTDDISGAGESEQSKGEANTTKTAQQQNTQKEEVLAAAEKKLSKGEGLGDDDEEGPGWTRGTKPTDAKGDAEVGEEEGTDADTAAAAGTRSEGEAKSEGIFGKFMSRFRSKKGDTDTDESPAKASKAERTRQHVEMGGEYMKQLGITGATAGESVGAILDKVILAIYAPQIGAVDQQTKITEAEQQILYKALDGVMSGAKDAGDAFNQTMQDQKQMTDAQIQAFNLGRG